MRLLILSILSFIFIGSSTLAISVWNFFPSQVVKPRSPEVKAAYTNMPPLPENVGGQQQPVFSAYAALAVDVDSQVIFLEKNPDLELLPASTTKIITSLVAMDYYSLEDILRVGQFTIEGQKMNLVTGEEISVKNLIYGLLVYSANDAAEVLAMNYPGGRDSFVTAMNLKTKELGLEHTSFENPTGLDGYSQFTTARDLVRVASVAIQDPFFRQVVGTKEITVESYDKRFVHKMNNINELLGKVDGVLGIKTGWTENARENLVAYIERGNRRVITVVLGSQDRFGETKDLIEWIFGNFAWREVPDF